MKSKYKYLLTITVSITIIALIAVVAINSKSTSGSSNTKIKVVAGENFWGSLVSQIGGDKVSVLSIVSDPNADPHEYESNTTDARAVSTANYVILNGAGYDSWGDKLLAASPSSTRVNLNVANLLGKKDGDNPHFWYSPSYVNIVINKMEENLAAIDPRDVGYFQNNLIQLKASLSTYQSRISDIKDHYGGTKVAATEDIFAYLAQAAGLDLISPPQFIQAVAEGNDPPASSVVLFQQQLASNQVKLMVYNEQTVTPLTTNMKKLATDNNIPIVGVTETIQPPNTTFQDWMNSQTIDLLNAINSQSFGQ